MTAQYGILRVCAEGGEIQDFSYVQASAQFRRDEQRQAKEY